MTSAPSARLTPGPQAPQTTGDTQYNVHDAALHGASTAFSKPPVKPKPLANTYTGAGNGALLAATKVGTGTPRSTTGTPSPSPLKQDRTGGSARSTGRPYSTPSQLHSKSSSSSNLGVPDDYFSNRTPSPSNIAAKLAAARFSPMRPLPQATARPVVRERDANEGDILPPSGSVGSVLARLDSRQTSRPPPKKRARPSSQSIANTARAPAATANATDDTSIPPTTSLVQMFEQSQQQPVEPATVSRAPPPVRSPKPQRMFKLPPEPIEDVPLEREKMASPPLVRPKPKLRPGPRPSDASEGLLGFRMLRQDSLGTPPVRQTSSQLAAATTTPSSRPQPPPQRGSRQARPKSQDLTRSTSLKRVSLSMDGIDNPSSPSSYASAPEEQEESKPKPKPSLPPPRRSARRKSESAHSDSRPTTAPTPLKPRTPTKLTSPFPPPETFAPARPATTMGPSPPPTALFHSNYQRESVKAISKHITGESLSDAIVGAALASSRNASPARPPSTATATPPIPSRRHHHHHHPFHSNRSPSPPKPSAKQPPGKLRTTLRKEPSTSSDEDEGEKYKRKGTRIMGLGRKHPNKHHEGTRKRWRDAVTERERKRYEGVWAANKELYIANSMPSSSRGGGGGGADPALDVLNLVVKELWLRSRLSENVLEEVWDLVDGRGVGRLRREEFVVGMWLVDQRLKGRKLPVRVSESVWASVRGAGVKVKVGAKM
ncbi:hypothetical protein BDV95DRAFT_581581 [Massariosphaeria phaeospora]|uniref:EH domain-containing protein n=1 Tax=Massariosphaeria phaeospora TaxID=100035 RepID=A0A7C8I2N7_9PLEO|nr:hypothetical protein BDV95DRAFT_581581 [Massariosphaeria phaeospora]